MIHQFIRPAKRMFDFNKDSFDIYKNRSAGDVHLGIPDFQAFKRFGLIHMKITSSQFIYPERKTARRLLSDWRRRVNEVILPTQN